MNTRSSIPLFLPPSLLERVGGEAGLGVVYYRIQSIDKDGQISYSEIRSLELGTRNGGISIYPNPARDFVKVSCNGMKEIKVINQIGQVIYKRIATGTNLRNDAIAINTMQVPKGLYIVQVITTKGEIKVSKLIVE